MFEVLIKACNKESFLLNVAKDSCVDYKVLQVMPTYNGSIGATMLCEFNTSLCKVDEIMSSINNYRSDLVGSIDYVEVEKKSEDEFYLLMRLGYYFGSEVFLRSGCLFNGCRCDQHCVMLNILTCGNGSLYEFIKSLKDHNYKVDIIKKRNFNLNGNLTNRQKNVLKRAYDYGYFDIPKRISLKELSNEIGISPSSTDEIIKRAQKKITSTYLLR